MVQPPEGVKIIAGTGFAAFRDRLRDQLGWTQNSGAWIRRASYYSANYIVDKD